MLELNKLSGEAIETTDLNQQDNAFHVAYVNVRLTALDSPRRADGIETITLELIGFDRFISVPYDDRFPTMLPESKWLSIFVITENGDLQFKHPVTNEIHEAKIAEMLMIQGPLK